MEIWITELDRETIYELLEESSTDDCQFVYKTSWDEGGKYSYQTVYFQRNKKLCSFSLQRSGSWFTEYHTEVVGYAKDIETRELLLSVLSSHSKLKAIIDAIYAEPDKSIAILDGVISEIYPPA